MILRFFVALALIASPAVAADPAKPYLSRAELRAKYGDPRGRIATIGGVEVYYKDEGKGPAILLIHGSASSLRSWDGVASALLKKHYRVIRFDIPPQGQSGPVSNEALAKLQPTDIPEQLLGQLGVTKVTAVGVSSGGTMAAFLAAKRPDLVTRVVMSNSPSDPVEGAKLTYTPAFQAALDEQKKTGFQNLEWWNAYLDYFGGAPAHFSPAMRQQYYDINRKQPEPNYIALVAKVRDNAVTRETMAQVRQPVLLIWGTRDPLLPLAAADGLATYLKNAPISRMLLPDVGHYPPVEVPERFAALVAAYIEAADRQ